MEDLIRLYTQARPGVRSEKHWLATQDVLARFAAAVGKPLAACKPYDLAAFVAANPQWESDWTKRRVIACIQRPFNWGVKMGLIDRNPFRGFGWPAGQAGRAMADEEFRLLLDAATVPFARILRFLRHTGCRPCEARLLEWQHIDPEAGLAVLREHKTRRTRKDGAARVIVLTGCVTQILVEVLEDVSGGDACHVFLNCKGLPWTQNAFSLQMQRLRARCGIGKECKLYGLRHRFGTVVAASGLPMKVLADLMGHTTTRMTEHYIHLAGQTEYLREALNRVDGL